MNMEKYKKYFNKDNVIRGQHPIEIKSFRDFIAVAGDTPLEIPDWIGGRIPLKIENEDGVVFNFHEIRLDSGIDSGICPKCNGPMYLDTSSPAILGGETYIYCENCDR